MSKTRSELSVYLFGGAKGESIVLQLPDGGWGVVDWYERVASRTRNSSALRLLEAEGVSKLEFVCLTHPHEDHFKGMSNLLENFEIKACWSFGGLLPPDFKLLKTFFETDAQTSDAEESRESARELTAILNAVQSKGIIHQAVGPKSLVYPSIGASEGFQLWGLAPSGRHVDEYRRCLLRSFGKDRTFKSALPSADHNLISSAFLVIFGTSRLILGGDVEKDGWRDVLDNKSLGNIAAHAVKIPHHGSANGYCDGLWTTIAAQGEPVGVLTPYATKSLPQRKALDHIRPHSRSIHSAAALSQHPDSYPTPVDRRLTRIRSALALKARAMRVDRVETGGCCQLTLDEHGNCRIRSSGDAARIG
jgi:hypothetical protein